VKREAQMGIQIK